MKIDFFRMLENNTKGDFGIKDFIKELESCLEENESKLQVFSQKIQEKSKISLISENRIIKEKNKIMRKYQNRPEKIEKEVKKMENRILRNQEQILTKNRKEGHLYMVEEDINERIYLLNLTEKNNYVFEEVDFPKKLLDKATEGAVFEYKNGTYCFYSYSGFEILENNK